MALNQSFFSTETCCKNIYPEQPDPNMAQIPESGMDREVEPDK